MEIDPATSAIWCDMPEGVTVAPVKNGLGVVATRAFSCGEFISAGSFRLIADEPATFEMHARENDCVRSFLLDAIVHAVQIPGGRRELYNTDSFKNHSCDPNTETQRDTQEDYDNGIYRYYAVRNIEPGEEMTVDYNTYEYDCTSKNIEWCCCGASHCVGAVRGFCFLSPEEQLPIRTNRLLPRDSPRYPFL